MKVSERTQSEFNDALGYLNRINSLFYAADDASITMNVQQWFHCLLAIYRELSAVMNEKELERAKELVNDINPKIRKSNNYYKRTGVNLIDNELYMELNDFEIWLRKIQKSAGLLLRESDDPSLALSN